MGRLAIHPGVRPNCGSRIICNCRQAVKITAQGWQVINNPPVKFIRRRGMLPLPTPVRGGSLGELRPLTNATEDHIWCLAVAWLVGTFSPGPYTILIVNGEQWLLRQGLSEAAVKTHCGNAKTIFNDAATRGLISKSPFDNLKSGATASKVDRYVTPEEIDAIIEACPTQEWKVLFGLARLAGLRTPSETHLLTWADVDWERARLTVRSPKTEHFQGREQRMVPITPKLMKVLQDAFDAAEPGQEHLVAIRGKGAVIRKVRTICQTAGVEPWPRLWQTLRSSCEKEWAIDDPQYAVSKWIGHSITISGRHYANSVPEELYAKAAGIAGEKAAHNARSSRLIRLACPRRTPGARTPIKQITPLAAGLCVTVQQIAKHVRNGAGGCRLEPGRRHPRNAP